MRSFWKYMKKIVRPHISKIEHSIIEMHKAGLLNIEIKDEMHRKYGVEPSLGMIEDIIKKNCK